MINEELEDKIRNENPLIFELTDAHTHSSREFDEMLKDYASGAAENMTHEQWDVYIKEFNQRMNQEKTSCEKETLFPYKAPDDIHISTILSLLQYPHKYKTLKNILQNTASGAQKALSGRDASTLYDLLMNPLSTYLERCSPPASFLSDITHGQNPADYYTIVDVAADGTVFLRSSSFDAPIESPPLSITLPLLLIFNPKPFASREEADLLLASICESTIVSGIKSTPYTPISTPNMLSVMLNLTFVDNYSLPGYGGTIRDLQIFSLYASLTLAAMRGETQKVALLIREMHYFLGHSVVEAIEEREAKPSILMNEYLESKNVNNNTSL